MLGFIFNTFYETQYRTMASKEYLRGVSLEVWLNNFILQNGTTQ